MRIERYVPGLRSEWDEFAASSINGTFLFYRDYMEYHSDRFTDGSLLLYEGTRLKALLPANRDGRSLHSHGGLTYGGLVVDETMTTRQMMAVMESLKSYLLDSGIGRLVYKAVPHIYHAIPAEADLYALHIQGARLIRRDVSSAIYLPEAPAMRKGRKAAARKAERSGVRVDHDNNIAAFMDIERAHLMRKYHKTPVHTAEEMQRLAARFPEFIKLYSAYHEGHLVAGVIIYESRRVAHAQYIAATEIGMAIGALDLVMSHIIHSYAEDKTYFDFGISTFEEGRALNHGLVRNKEGFGARPVLYDFYRLDLQ